MKTRKILSLLLILIVAGCIDEQSIHLPAVEPRIAIDALITAGPEGSVVNIGWTAPVGHACRDNFGSPVKCEPQNPTGPFTVTGTVILENAGTHLSVQKDFAMNNREGYVQLAFDFQGTPGNEYVLSVEVNYSGNVQYYQARTTMLSTPPIDSISYTIRKGDVGKNDNLVPLISFVDPPEKNYYLFQLCHLSGAGASSVCSNNRVWSYSLIDDTFLPAEVKNLSIDDGASIAKYAEFYPAPGQDAGAEVKMFSVNKTTYLFYKALIEQFNNDGGAYSPTPATPQGNIPGAIGLFRAVHEQNKRIFF